MAQGSFCQWFEYVLHTQRVSCIHIKGGIVCVYEWWLLRNIEDFHISYINIAEGRFNAIKVSLSIKAFRSCSVSTRQQPSYVSIARILFTRMGLADSNSRLFTGISLCHCSLQPYMLSLVPKPLHNNYSSTVFSNSCCKRVEMVL